MHALRQVRSAFHLAFHLIDTKDKIASVCDACEGFNPARCEAIFLTYVVGRVGESGYIPHRDIAVLFWHGPLHGVCMAGGGP